MQVVIQEVNTREAFEQTLAIRREVFIEEQGVPEALEIDAYDEDISTHYLLARSGEGALGTLRMRSAHDAHTLKIERVAVKKAARGMHIGQKLMEEAERWARAHGYRRLYLHAQKQVVPFYEKIGFHGLGAPFIEADIEHLAMEKWLTQYDLSLNT
ncbi:MAG: GNAT family acetyltransferase YjcF [Candidatus Carbobacillus altaicus]|uniref:GNAT family acetyltransferase YjcF n=1 Tax=Candidatus Carbonibacillus altaicus TaxID=2163959 RepID=A0A2R6Y157_9BACL|nr:MAG: GNAT family acetyltransferase YjcF [Candidatus Carbobacillus altaicus]